MQVCRVLLLFYCKMIASFSYRVKRKLKKNSFPISSCNVLNNKQYHAKIPFKVKVKSPFFFQTKKLSIHLSFFFHEVLQHLKTFIYTSFQLQRVLRFGIEDALISRLLPDAAFSWWLRKLFTWIKNVTNFLRYCCLNVPCLSHA